MNPDALTIGPTKPLMSGSSDVGAVMRQVLYALVPGLIASIIFFGPGILINVAVAVAVALACEAAILALRGRAILPVLSDYSAVVTAVLLAMALPPLTPWWLTAVGILFAIVIAKHLYGGLGFNPFNPAMVGYVVLLISFPRDMTQWLPPAMLSTHTLSFMQQLQFVFGGHLPAGIALDAVTTATPLDSVKTQLGLGKTLATIQAAPLFGALGGRGWEWINGWFALGGLWLLYRRIIGWQIPVGMLGALMAIAGVFYLINPDTHAGPLFHVFSGAAIFGAFFIATDPVTAASTPRGRLIYGAGIGLLTYLIRSYGGYPDGVAFGVLLMNMAAPMIDYTVRPRAPGARDV